MPMPLVDARAVESSEGFRRCEDLPSSLFELVVGLMESVGGTGVVEVDPDSVFAVWTPPPVGEGVDARRMAYLSHMLQAGAMFMPRELIANTAYAGLGMPLARALVSFSGLNPYVAERDSGILADAMPFCAQAWLAHGIVLMDVGKHKAAAVAISTCALLEPSNVLARRCLAVCLTGTSPRRAVAAAEEMMSLRAAEGVPPDAHERATYGFALLSAGLSLEAKAQFMAAGLPVPAMTPRQWREWGHKVDAAMMAKAMADPKGFAPKGNWDGGGRGKAGKG